jgi:hypothetical protein
MKLGKLPFTDDDRDLRLADLQEPLGYPEEFGHEEGIDWQGMLGNDEAGDCVWAGAAHENIVLGAEGGHHPTFSTENILKDYSAVTGYVVGDESTDKGTEVRAAMKYRKAKGIHDASGHRHHIGAYLRLKPKDLGELYRAVYTFGVVGIGIEFPESAMNQFNEGNTWRVSNGSPIVGGHYVPVVARRDGQPVCVTGGKTQPMTEAFFETYCDEAWCYVSSSALKDGKTPDGLDKTELLAALKSIK